MKPRWTQSTGVSVLQARRRHHLVYRPHMIRHPGLHCWRNAQRLMNPAKTVVNEIDGDHVPVIVGLLGEPIGQPGESAHSHPNGEIGTLNIAG